MSLARAAGKLVIVHAHGRIGVSLKRRQRDQGRTLTRRDGTKLYGATVIATHALTVNGRVHGEVMGFDSTPENELRRMMTLLDGIERYSLILWELPPGCALDEVDLDAWPAEFIQVAGSEREKVIEERLLVNGMPEHTVIGHAIDGKRGWTSVAWNGCVTTVLESEIFDTDEAAEMFVSYYSGNGVPPKYTRRPMNPRDTRLTRS